MAMDKKNLQLLAGDDPMLSQVCRVVTYDDDISDLVAELKRICKEHRGIGLAANQIGSDLRVFILNTSCTKTYVNPEILEAEKEEVFYGEGCLSFPGEMYCTLRFSKLKIRSDSGPDEILTGIEAVAFQHELDHLDGITMHKRKIQ
jgi:peptide deformylase